MAELIRKELFMELSTDLWEFITYDEWLSILNGTPIYALDE